MTDHTGEYPLRDKAERAVGLLRHSARVSPILREAVDDVSRYIRSIEAENERLRERIDRLEWAILHPSVADALALRADLLEASHSGSSEAQS